MQPVLFRMPECAELDFRHHPIPWRVHTAKSIDDLPGEDRRLFSHGPLLLYGGFFRKGIELVLDWSAEALQLIELHVLPSPWLLPLSLPVYDNGPLWSQVVWSVPSDKWESLSDFLDNIYCFDRLRNISGVSGMSSVSLNSLVSDRSVWIDVFLVHKMQGAQRLENVGNSWQVVTTDEHNNRVGALAYFAATDNADAIQTLIDLEPTWQKFWNRYQRAIVDGPEILPEASE